MFHQHPSQEGPCGRAGGSPAQVQNPFPTLLRGPTNPSCTPTVLKPWLAPGRGPARSSHIVLPQACTHTHPYTYTVRYGHTHLHTGVPHTCIEAATHTSCTRVCTHAHTLPRCPRTGVLMPPTQGEDARPMFQLPLRAVTALPWAPVASTAHLLLPPARALNGTPSPQLGAAARAPLYR